MSELERARQFAKSNDGVDAVLEESDYNGKSLYKFIPFLGCEGMKLGLPILFSRDERTFSFLSRNEVREYIDWSVKDVRYEDD